MSSASEELAKKKARLAELRQAKEARLIAASSAPAPAKLIQSVEEILAAVGVAPASPERALPATRRTDAPPENPVLSTPLPTGSSGARGKLTFSEATILVDIPGRSAVEVYEKVTQTDAAPEDECAADGSGRSTTAANSTAHQLHAAGSADAHTEYTSRSASTTGAEQKPVSFKLSLTHVCMYTCACACISLTLPRWSHADGHASFSCVCRSAHTTSLSLVPHARWR